MLDRAVKSDSDEANERDPDRMEVAGQRTVMCRHQTFAEKCRFNGTTKRLRIKMERMGLLIVSSKLDNDTWLRP